MTAICEADVKAVLGETDALVLQELVRTKATADELAQAIEFVRDPTRVHVKIRDNLLSRVQRLVDLLSVTDLGDGETRTHAA